MEVVDLVVESQFVSMEFEIFHVNEPIRYVDDSAVAPL